MAMLVFFVELILSGSVQAQCLTQVTAITGTQTFSCTNVTVTSNGSVDNGTFCTGIGPYWIGKFAPGNYSFSFSQPVSGVTLDFDGFDNTSTALDIVTININGVPYFITDAGVPNSCEPLPVIVNGMGALIGSACPDPLCHSSCDGVNINQMINTITISDNWTLGGTGGVAFSLYFCCGACRVDAGTLGHLMLQLCPGGVATVPPATDTYLGVGDVLQYVLFSDPNDTLGSIISTSNTPTFSFNPATMQEGITYFIAAMAGENLNGDVDLNDECLDFSNAIRVIWWPTPSVSFDTDAPGVCPGECTTITANFTGTPPFILTYTNSLLGTVTQTFPGNSGTFQVCGPVGSPPGNIGIQASSLVDGHCTCH